MVLHRDYPEGNMLNCDNLPYSLKKIKTTDIIWNNYDWLGSLNKAGYLHKAIMENIDKTLLCNTIYLGYDAFECPNCHNVNLLYRRCHSHFCSSCSVKKQEMVAVRVSEMAIGTFHRYKSINNALP